MHTWNHDPDEGAIQNAYPSLGTLSGCWSPARRPRRLVRPGRADALDGSKADVTLTGDAFRSKFGLRSNWFRFGSGLDDPRPDTDRPRSRGHRRPDHEAQGDRWRASVVGRQRSAEYSVAGVGQAFARAGSLKAGAVAQVFGRVLRRTSAAERPPRGSASMSGRSPATGSGTEQARSGELARRHCRWPAVASATWSMRTAVRRVGLALPRTYEAFIGVAGSSRSASSSTSPSRATRPRWDSAIRRDERDGLIASDPETFFLPPHLRPALPVGVRAARPARRAGDARAGHRRVADVRAEDAAGPARAAGPGGGGLGRHGRRRVGRVRPLLHPYLHWQDRDGELRGRTKVLAHLHDVPTPKPPSRWRSGTGRSTAGGLRLDAGPRR